MLSRGSYLEAFVNVAELDLEIIFGSDQTTAEYKQAVLRNRELQALKLFVFNEWLPHKNYAVLLRRNWLWHYEIGICDKFLFVGQDW